MASCVLSSERDINTLVEEDVVGRLRKVVAIQVYSDGGFTGEQGAAAFVVSCVYETEDGFERELVGSRGVLLKDAVSAFCAEVLAFDLPTEFLERTI